MSEEKKVIPILVPNFIILMTAFLISIFTGYSDAIGIPSAQAADIVTSVGVVVVFICGMGVGAIAFCFGIEWAFDRALAEIKVLLGK